MKTHLILILAFAASLFGAATAKVEIAPDDAVIVVPADADGTVRFAGEELRRHLKMITGKAIPIQKKQEETKFNFVLGTPSGATLQPEEARWELSPRRALIYGDSTPTGPEINPDRILSSNVKSGDLYAVYDFLEKQFGMLFLEPGAEGTSFTPSPLLKMHTGKGSWTPGRLVQRQLRGDRPLYHYKRIVTENAMPDEFKPAYRDYARKNRETLLWLKQQRMGRSESFRFGHAFTQWWNRYGKEHPEYFALFQGKRAPARPKQPDTIKMCVSSPGFKARIVEEWRNSKDRSKFVNVCENDWGDYCECPECRKLDMPPLPGKKWDDDLSDRYLNYANDVVRLARKIDPKAEVCHYAYSVYRFPPRREKVASGVVLGFVPSMMEIDEVATQYQKWREAGADRMLQRPNDHHINSGLPMGFEKTLFDHFQVGVKNGIVGTDYDALHGFWPASGAADYILARGHVDPSKSFDHWMEEYCSAYGNAAPEVKAYFAYYRKHIWEERLWPNRNAILERGRYGNFRRGLMWDIHQYYRPADFDATDALIGKGLKKELTDQQRNRLEKLKLANIHARLTFQALAAKGAAKQSAALELLRFRRANRTKLNFNWERLFFIELGFGDITGIKLASQLGDYRTGSATPVKWYFAPDPANVGEKEKWQDFSIDRIRSSWDMLRTDAAWETQNDPSLHPKLRALLKNYNGIAWYAQSLKIDPKWKGSEIALLFGAVDESAWVYVNGKLCGTHIFKKDDDWKMPFAIPIADAIDWTKPAQTVVVRVEDKEGLGGIWRPVMLVSR